MKQNVALTVAVLGWAWAVGAAESGFKKPYFGATTPGTFARQRGTDEKGAVTEYTYSRLIVTFKGTETIDGKRADRYGYEYKGAYMTVLVESGKGARTALPGWSWTEP